MNKFSITLTPTPPAGSHVYGANEARAARDKAHDVAATLFADNPAHERIAIEISEACPVCDGTGQKPGKRRNPLRQIPCKGKGCNGGWLPDPWRETLTRLDSALDHIKVLWREPETLSLWGIPYEMRRDVGQTPYHLWKAAMEWKQPPPSYVLGTPKRTSISDWIWLGSPGWWGHYTEGSEDRKSVETFLNCIPKEAIPGNACEWTRIGRNEEGFWQLLDPA